MSYSFESKEHFEAYQNLVRKIGHAYDLDPAKMERRCDSLLKRSFTFFYFLLTLVLICAVLGEAMRMSSDFRGIGLTMIAIFLGIFCLERLFRKKEERNYIEIFRDDYPALINRIDTLTKDMGLPKIERFYLSHDRNAGAGFDRAKHWNKAKPYIVLGGRLLVECSPEEIDWVIAHEIAHHLASDAEMAYKVHFCQEACYNLMSFFPFLRDWLWEAQAISEVSSRSKERQADEVAKRVSNPDVMSIFFIRSALSRWMYDPVLSRAFGCWVKESVLPIPDFYCRASRLQPEENPVYAEVFHKLFRRATGHFDSHPSLSERLRSAGIEFESSTDRVLTGLLRRALEPIGVSGYAAYLESEGSPAAEKLNAGYVKESEGVWRSSRLLYKFCAQQYEKFGKDVTKMSAEECDSVVLEVFVREGGKAALEFIRCARKVYPDDLELLRSEADYAALYDPLVVEPLYKEMLGREELQYEALYLRYYFAWHFGDAFEYEAKKKQFEDAYFVEQERRAKISGFTYKTELKHHKLKHEEQASWLEAAKEFPEIQVVYAYRRDNPEFEWLFVNAVVIVIKSRNFKLAKERDEERIARQLRKASGGFPDTELYVYDRNHQLSKFLRKKHGDKLLAKLP